MSEFESDKNNIRFHKLLEQLDLRFPVAEISRKTKYTKGNISNYINNKKPVSDNFLETFIKEFDVKDVEDSENGENPVYENSKQGVPYYDIDFTLSFVGVENSQQANPDTYVTHPFFNGCDYIVRASGQSMAKLIKHGDAIGLIKINNWQEFIPLGEIYAIVTKNGFRMVKIITKGKDDHHFKLISKPSDNKKDEFPDQEIKKSNIIQVYKVQASSHLF